MLVNYFQFSFPVSEVRYTLPHRLLSAVMGKELSKIETERNELRKLVLNHKRPFSKQFEPSRFNVLVMGEIGSGKSTVINAFNTALSPDDILHMPSLALSLPDDHVTGAFKRYKLCPNHDLFAYDTWGIYFGQTYLDDSLRKILVGLMPTNSDKIEEVTRDEIGGNGEGELEPNLFSENAQEVYPKVVYPEEIQKKKQMHMVVFCVKASKPYAKAPQDGANFETASAIGKLMKEIHETTGIVSVVLLTACDLLTDKVLLSESVESFRRHPKVAEARENVSHAIGVPKNLVIPMLANVDDLSRNPLIDATALKVLKNLLDHSQSRYEQLLGQKRKDQYGHE